MEPIRPDDDELRAEPPIGGAEPRKPDGQKSKSASNRQKPPKPPKPEKTSGGGSPGGGLLMWLVLVVVAAGAGAGWYVQNERIEALEGQLEEADYWARQSKLALARFEGELSETGESLQERGASLEEKIAANDKRLDSADSEIRKLWVIANERNKKRLDEHQQRLADVDDQLAQVNKAASDLTASLEQARTGLSADVAQVRQRLDDSLVSLERANQEATQQLTRLSQQIGDVDQVVENRIGRFEQEQKLGISGMGGQIAALEQKVESMAGDGEVRALRNQLSELKKTVDAVDASRSQLTSRLVRLSEEVNQLRSQVSGN
ncbi:hypothetical protein [Marinobacter sp. NSM]|uniref:hypothetical protein n=1 Tax=Marinobacter sp. NSM TaxID=3458004 RepID=UPI0040352303